MKNMFKKWIVMKILVSNNIEYQKKKFQKVSQLIVITFNFFNFILSANKLPKMFTKSKLTDILYCLLLCFWSF